MSNKYTFLSYIIPSISPLFRSLFATTLSAIRSFIILSLCSLHLTPFSLAYSLALDNIMIAFSPVRKIQVDR
ncbi:hypothetical protein AB4K20DRAFT_1901362 [Rhizopus microsporus]